MFDNGDARLEGLHPMKGDAGPPERPYRVIAPDRSKVTELTYHGRPDVPGGVERVGRRAVDVQSRVEHQPPPADMPQGLGDVAAVRHIGPHLDGGPHRFPINRHSKKQRVRCVSRGPFDHAGRRVAVRSRDIHSPRCVDRDLRHREGDAEGHRHRPVVPHFVADLDTVQRKGQILALHRNRVRLDHDEATRRQFGRGVVGEARRCDACCHGGRRAVCQR